MPDLILLDIIMPTKSGFEVLEELKTYNKLKDIPVVIISNLFQQADIEKGLALGAIDYLVKSNYFLEEIIKKVKNYI